MAWGVQFLRWQNIKKQFCLRIMFKFILIISEEKNPLRPTCGALQHWLTNVTTSNETMRDIVESCNDI